MTTVADLRTLIAERRAIAEKAWPGPWSYSETRDGWDVGATDPPTSGLLPPDDDSMGDYLVASTADVEAAAHIAAMHPAVTLALLDVAAEMSAQRTVLGQCPSCFCVAECPPTCTLERLAAALGGGA